MNNATTGLRGPKIPFLPTIFCVILYCLPAPAKEESSRIFDIIRSPMPAVEGFAKTISASNAIDYISFRGENTESYLEYATDGKEFVEWETAPAPKHIVSDEVAFIWTCGLGTNKELGDLPSHKLFINGKGFFSVRFPRQCNAIWKNGAYTLIFDYLFSVPIGDVRNPSP